MKFSFLIFLVLFFLVGIEALSPRSDWMKKGDLTEEQLALVPCLLPILREGLTKENPKLYEQWGDKLKGEVDEKMDLLLKIPHSYFRLEKPISIEGSVFLKLLTELLVLEEVYFNKRKLEKGFLLAKINEYLRDYIDFFLLSSFPFVGENPFSLNLNVYKYTASKIEGRSFNGLSIRRIRTIWLVMRKMANMGKIPFDKGEHMRFLAGIQAYIDFTKPYFGRRLTQKSN